MGRDTVPDAGAERRRAVGQRVTREIRDALGRCAGTRARRWLLAATLLLGLLAAVALGVGLPSGERTFTMLAEPVQSLMSFTLPFLGVLIAGDVVRSAPLGPTLLAAILLAVAVAILGAVFCAVTLALVPPGADAWAQAGMIVAGGCLVQIVANLTGTGLGLLLRPALAIPATVVPPLGLYLLLGAVDVLRPAQGWLTPYAALRDLLSGEMSALDWAQWAVVAAIWAVGLNAAGWLRRNRRSGRSTA
jgi:hypothetical protein